MAGFKNPRRKPGRADTLAKVSDYRPPISDLCFVLEHDVDYSSVAALRGFEHGDLEAGKDLLDECGLFMAKVIAPSDDGPAR